MVQTKFVMDKLFHPTLFWECDYLCMLRLKLIMLVKAVLDQYYGNMADNEFKIILS